MPTTRAAAIEAAPPDGFPMPPPLSSDELRAFLAREFPQIHDDFVVEDVAPMRSLMRLVFRDRHLRPGGTISGPAMFGLADVSLYAAILGSLGPVALAVTTNLNINFIRRPEPVDLLGEARLLKLGRRLAVGEVSIISTANGELVAHAVGTYSVPPRDTVF